MITTIALDYGRVLAAPVSGDWFFPKQFWKMLGLRGALQLLIGAPKMNNARRRGGEYLDAHLLVRTEAEEYEHFDMFYQIVLSGIGLTHRQAQICEQLAQYAVYNDSKVFFYDDVLPGIAKLKEQYRVVLISDTWPSIRRVLAHAGVLPLLDDLVLSCDYGATKGDGRLYEIAMEQHGLVPGECLVVDDSERNLRQAIALGFPVVCLERHANCGKAGTERIPIVRNLEEARSKLKSTADLAVKL